MDSYAGYVVQTFVTLLAVCGVAFVVLYGARRLGVGRARGPITLVGQLPLEARRAIYLVRVGEQVIVVGASESGFTRLGEVAAAELSTAEPAAVRGSFAGGGLLGRLGDGGPFRDVLARAKTSGARTSGARTSVGTSAAKVVDADGAAITEADELAADAAPAADVDRERASEGTRS